MASAPPAAERFHSLDAARGLAALLVVVFHWPHMLHAVSDQIPPREVLPLYTLFLPIYIHGWMAVDFFFVLSGFIFFCLYYERISEKKIDQKSFFRVRFSRLYPLHLLSMIIVLAFQNLYYDKTGRYFIYQHNSILDVLKNLLFAQAWIPRSPESLNGPTWSVSVEILLYLSFFMTALFRCGKTWVLVLVTCVGIVLDPVLSPLGRGFAGFYLGGVIYRIYISLSCRQFVNSNIHKLAIALLVVWAVSILVNYNMPSIFAWGAIDAEGGLGRMLSKITSYSFRFGLLPLTVLVLALVDSRYSSKLRHIGILGDISYSSYLLHFPLQIVFALYALSMDIDNIYNSYYLSIYMLLLIVMSWITFRYFEYPVKKFIGNRRIRGRSNDIRYI